MQEVVESAVRLKIRTENNPLRRGLNARCITVANERGAWLMSKEDDKLIISCGLTIQNRDYANKLEEDFDSIHESDQKKVKRKIQKTKTVMRIWVQHGRNMSNRLQQM